MAKSVTEFQLGWHPGHDEGFIKVRLKNAATMEMVPINSTVEWIAVATLLKQGPTYLHDDGSLRSGIESDQE